MQSKKTFPPSRNMVVISLLAAFLALPRPASAAPNEERRRIPLAGAPSDGPVFLESKGVSRAGRGLTDHFVF